MANLKKIAAIHDIAGFGRSSLTVVLPTLAAMGHQVCPVPTAVLSTITGFFEGYTLHDLSSQLDDYLKHWQKENLHIDCVYSGFLGSPSQADIACNFIDKLNPSLVVVDPVFADEGKLYACFDDKITQAMRKLIGKAHIITPNGSEAGFLLGEDKSPDTPQKAGEYAKRLSEMGPQFTVITSVPSGMGKISIVIYDKKENKTYKIENPFLSHAHYPGTGDLFTSVLTGQVLSGDSVTKSASKAADFVFASIKNAVDNNLPVREGVAFEPMLPRLFTEHLLDIEEI